MPAGVIGRRQAQCWGRVESPPLGKRSSSALSIVLARGKRRVDRRRALAIDHLELPPRLLEDLHGGGAAIEARLAAVEIERALAHAVICDVGLGDDVLQRGL